MPTIGKFILPVFAGDFFFGGVLTGGFMVCV
jgi:hypothetical protein